MRLRKTILLSSLLFLLCASAALGQDGSFCPLLGVDTSGLPAQLPISVRELTFQTRLQGTVSTLQVQNKDLKPIGKIFVVIDFYKSDRYLLSMTYYAATPDDSSSFHPVAPFSSMFMSAWPMSESLLPGKSMLVEADSPILTAECPDKGRIAVLQTAFSQAPTFEARASGWRADAWLLTTKPWPLAGFPKTSLNVSVNVTVDEAGTPHVTAMGDLRGNPVAPKLSSWLAEQIEKKWTFLPATYDGSPIASEMELLIRFYATRTRQNPFTVIPRSWGITTVTVVDVISRMKGHSYEMYFGGTAVSAAAGE